MRSSIRALILVGVAALGGAAWAAPRLGPETGLPLPRFVSLRSGEANVRRGPGLTHRIDWVFQRKGMPLEVVAEHGQWRRVRDADDAGGWIHQALLSAARTAVVVAAPEAVLRRDPALDAAPVARAETGVVGQLDACRRSWCRFEAEGQRGWIDKGDIWGVRPDEEFD